MMSFVRPKYFVKNTNLNLILAKPVLLKDKNAGVLSIPTTKVKICMSTFLKILKLKKNFCSFIANQDPSLGLKFQTNGFYTSQVEFFRKNKIKILQRKILVSKGEKIVKNYFNKVSSPEVSLFKQRNLKFLSTGFEKFDLFQGDYLKTTEKRQVFLKILKTKRFFSKVFFSRLFLYTVKGRKRYKNPFFYLLKRRRKINSLFHVYTLSSLKFRDIKQQRRRFLKKIIFKRRKQKKWKKRWSSVFFRLRQKLSQVFYVPKHFEINYKTFGTYYLGYTDIKTTSTRIPFWLNLRKLLTFLS